jgi:hypothetical protein
VARVWAVCEMSVWGCEFITTVTLPQRLVSLEYLILPEITTCDSGRNHDPIPQHQTNFQTSGGRQLRLWRRGREEEAGANTHVVTSVSRDKGVFKNINETQATVYCACVCFCVCVCARARHNCTHHFTQRRPVGLFSGLLCAVSGLFTYVCIFTSASKPHHPSACNRH